MKVIHHVQGDDLTDLLTEDQLENMYETEGMFDEQGNKLGIWCHNDAMWRGEYYDHFMAGLGIDVDGPPEDPVVLKKISEAFVKAFCC